MRIPDETHYEPGEKHVEDRKGFVLCTQCDKCPLNSETTIRPDGSWRCFYFDKWKKGDDILEYKCPGYRQKACASCKRKYFCPDVDKAAYCQRYTHLGMAFKEREFFGRRRPLQTTDPVVLEREHNYTIEKYRRLDSELQ